MPITQFPPSLLPLSSGKEFVEVDGDTVFEVIKNLDLKFPGLADRIMTKDHKLKNFVCVFIGDEDVKYLEGLDTKVQKETKIMILSAVAGG